eukprot:g3484.t1
MEIVIMIMVKMIMMGVVAGTYRERFATEPITATHLMLVVFSLGVVVRSAPESCERAAPCTIPRVSRLDMDTFAREYEDKMPVIIIEGLDRNTRIRDVLDKRNMLDRYGDETITTGTANSFTGRQTKRMALADYMNYMANPQPLNRTGNTTWYLFGDNAEPFWTDIVALYRFPTVAIAQRVVEPGRPMTPVVGLGGINSGVPFHVHGEGWSEVIHGAKRWFLFPRNGKRPVFDPNKSQYQWLWDEYHKLGDEERLSLHECTIKPGEVLYFPSQWYHATLNIEPYTAFVSLFA